MALSVPLAGAQPASDRTDVQQSSNVDMPDGARFGVVKCMENDEVKCLYNIGKCEIQIGRLSQGDIRVYLKEVSRRHCTLQIDQDGVMWLINHSQNGTRVNGTSLKPGDRVCVESGDCFSIEGRLFELLLRDKTVIQYELLNAAAQEGENSENSENSMDAPERSSAECIGHAQPTDAHMAAESILSDSTMASQHPRIPRTMSMNADRSGEVEDGAAVPTTTSIADDPIADDPINDAATEADYSNAHTVLAGTATGPSDAIAVGTPVGNELCRRRTLTWGPSLEPELYDRDAPPNTPIRRGARIDTPRHGQIRSALRGSTRQPIFVEPVAPALEYKHQDLLMEYQETSPEPHIAEPFSLHNPVDMEYADDNESEVLDAGESSELGHMLATAPAPAVCEDTEQVEAAMQTALATELGAYGIPGTVVNPSTVAAPAVSEEIRHVEAAMPGTPAAIDAHSTFVSSVASECTDSDIDSAFFTPDQSPVHDGMDMAQPEQSTPLSFPQRLVSGLGGLVGQLFSPSQHVVTPNYNGLRDLLRTPRQPGSSEDLTGVRETFQTPKPAEEVQLYGVRELVQTPTVTSEPQLAGIRELMATPRQAEGPQLAGVREMLQSPRPAEEMQLAGVREMMKTPQSSQEPELVGVREMMKTPRPAEEPQLVGVRELLSTPTTAPEPCYIGVRELVRTPAQASNAAADYDGMAQLLQTPELPSVQPESAAPSAGLQSVDTAASAPEQTSQPTLADDAASATSLAGTRRSQRTRSRITTKSEQPTPTARTTTRSRRAAASTQPTITQLPDADESANPAADSTGKRTRKVADTPSKKARNSPPAPPRRMTRSRRA